jgi:hypothetical protein
LQGKLKSIISYSDGVADNSESFNII